MYNLVNLFLLRRSNFSKVLSKLSSPLIECTCDGKNNDESDLNDTEDTVCNIIDDLLSIELDLSFSNSSSILSCSPIFTPINL